MGFGLKIEQRPAATSLGLHVARSGLRAELSPLLGGSVCESNAPATSEMPPAGFEVEAPSGREAERERAPGARCRNPESGEGTLLWRKRVRVERTGDIRDAARRF
jgi:hypothetical protein